MEVIFRNEIVTIIKNSDSTLTVQPVKSFEESRVSQLERQVSEMMMQLSDLKKKISVLESKK